MGVSSQSLSNIANNAGGELTNLAAAQQNLTGADIAQEAMQVQERQLQQQALVSLGTDIGQMPLINILT